MDIDVQLDTLAIAAHPDDAEITCGGLLIKLADQSRAVGVLDLTRGEMGTRGDENDRAAEAAAARKALGLVYRENAGIPDSAVEYTQENKLKIARFIRRARPEMVVLPHWIQRHPDHLACSRLGYDACFLAGLAKAPIDGEPYRPRKIIYVSYFRNTDYTFLTDISEQFERKMNAVAAYKSQFGESSGIREAVMNGVDSHDIREGERDIFHPGANVFDLMHIRARQLGQLVGVKYAEAYTIRENLLIDDPQKLSVRSI